MYEILGNIFIMAADFINQIFELQVEWQAGQMVAIGKISLAFMYLALTIYFIVDCMGLLDGGD